MIDLHLHLLPDVDDGSSSMAMSLSMLESLAAMDVTGVVATPHLMTPLTDDYRQLVEATMDAVAPQAASRGIAVGLGYEHLLAPDLARRLEAGEPTTMGGSSAVLVEVPFIGWPQHAESSLFALRVANYVPILAHPERYLDVQKDPEIALAAGQAGAVLQITSGSFAGVYGKPVERTARRLLAMAIERDVVVALASDAHSDGLRLTRVPDGLGWIRTRVSQGDAVLEWASNVVPRRLLASATAPSFHQWLAGERPELVSQTAQASDGDGAPAWRRLVGRLTG